MTPCVTSLEARYYTDPEIFRIEQEGLFASAWQFAFHSSELASPGDYYCFDIADDSLFAVHGRDDEIRIFHNVCQHRAHRLLEGRGHLRSSIVCPYHAWTYELTGALRSGPGLASVPGIDRSSISLSEVRSENFCGFIFVNIDGSAPSMDDMFPQVRTELEEFLPAWKRLKPLEWIEVSERCNWKVSVENYSECYHCQLNHPTFSTGVVKPDTYRYPAAGVLSASHDRMSESGQDDVHHRFGAAPFRRLLVLVPVGRCSRFRFIPATC